MCAQNGFVGFQINKVPGSNMHLTDPFDVDILGDELLPRMCIGYRRRTHFNHGKTFLCFLELALHWVCRGDGSVTRTHTPTRNTLSLTLCSSARGSASRRAHSRQTRQPPAMAAWQWKVLLAAYSAVAVRSTAAAEPLHGDSSQSRVSTLAWLVSAAKGLWLLALGIAFLHIYRHRVSKQAKQANDQFRAVQQQQQPQCYAPISTATAASGAAAAAMGCCQGAEQAAGSCCKEGGVGASSGDDTTVGCCKGGEASKTESGPCCRVESAEAMAGTEGAKVS